MFSLTVGDHMTIIHSFQGEVFGPAQRQHGAKGLTPLNVTLHQSRTAWASYEGAL
ncbi:MAG: hypothetical protein U9Q35_15920 [Pseudomonadota bacterium]|nr:hypothetical protein [Pseudomonadota bacterium]